MCTHRPYSTALDSTDRQTLRQTVHRLSRQRIEIPERVECCEGSRSKGMVELSIRNRAVVGSNPTGGSGGPVVRHRSGFTLVEILVVLILMGLVAALVVPALLPRHHDQSEVNAVLGRAREVAARRGEVVYVHIDPTG